MKAKNGYLGARKRAIGAMTMLASAALAAPAFADVPGFVETPVNSAPVAAPKATASQEAAAEPSGGGADFVEQQVGDGAASAVTTPPKSNPFGFLDNIQRSSVLFGDLWGLRPLLARYGATLERVL